MDDRDPNPLFIQLTQALRLLLPILGVAGLLATLFTLWTPQALLSEDPALVALQTATPNPAATLALAQSEKPLVGIVAGHAGHDSGAVCVDGLQEVTINTDVAQRVQLGLEAAGFRVDLLGEFDSRLQGYQARALVSIHADSCQYINDQATGYKVAGSSESRIPDESTRLANCLTERYKTRTGMNFHANTVTYDMTQYHAYREISPDTPAAIIEVGFMNLDREILTTQSDLVAQGIVDGILCYINREALKAP